MPGVLSLRCRNVLLEVSKDGLSLAIGHSLGPLVAAEVVNDLEEVHAAVVSGVERAADVEVQTKEGSSRPPRDGPSRHRSTVMFAEDAGFAVFGGRTEVYVDVRGHVMAKKVGDGRVIRVCEASVPQRGRCEVCRRARRQAQLRLQSSGWRRGG